MMPRSSPVPPPAVPVGFPLSRELRIIAFVILRAERKERASPVPVTPSRSRESACGRIGHDTAPLALGGSTLRTAAHCGRWPAASTGLRPGGLAFLRFGLCPAVHF